MYEQGRGGLPKDYVKAMLWYKRAAEQGHADAQHNVGAAYAAGRGVPQDATQAAVWYRLAAQQGHALARAALLRMAAAAPRVWSVESASCRSGRSALLASQICTKIVTE